MLKRVEREFIHLLKFGDFFYKKIFIKCATLKQATHGHDTRQS